jgi:uncharacterized protein DUF6624
VLGLLLCEELLSMAAEDGAVRARLAEDASLFDGYNPLMAIVHRRNGDRLAEIVDEHGWPGISLVGEDGADAAWLVLKHAISQPDLQRRLLPVVEGAVAAGDAPPWHAATLEDGIAFYEGRPQRYGTMFDWDESGDMRPWMIEDPAGVDERRALVGLPRLAEQLAGMQGGAEAEGENRPADPKARLREADEWARSVGWR